MALLRGLKQGQDYKIFRPKWRGMAPDIDPQNLGEDQPYLSINTRNSAGVAVQRGGQSLCVDLGGKITGIATHQIGAARSLFVTGDGCPGLSAGAGSYLGVVDQEFKDPAYVGEAGYTAYKNATYYATATAQIVAGTFGDDLMFGLDNVLKRFSAADSLQETRLNLPTGYSSISAMIEHEGTFLIAAVGTAASGVGTSAIFSFDGVTLTNELSAINVVKGFGLYRDMCAAIFDGTPNSIRIRTAAGVWGAPVLPSAGTVKIIGSNTVSFQDKLYIPNGDEDFFALDQTGTLTRIPIATSGVDAGGHIMGVDVLENVMYFVWHNAALTNVWIGKFDGTTWTPKFKDLTAQATYPALAQDFVASGVPTGYVPGIARCIRAYRGSLVVAAIQPPAGIAALYFSPRAAVSGTWTRIIMSISYANSDINEMLVF